MVLMVLMILIRIEIFALLSNLGAAKVKTLDLKRSQRSSQQSGVSRPEIVMVTP